MMEIRLLSALEALPYLGALAEVLRDCVEGGASVGFMAPLAKVTAESFFAKAIEGVRLGERILLAAFVDSELVGTVQMVTATPPNQRHRADVAKLLVRSAARGQGVAFRLMEQVDEASREAGKTLLVLDTVTGSCRRKAVSAARVDRSGSDPPLCHVSGQRVVRHDHLLEATNLEPP